AARAGKVAGEGDFQRILTVVRGRAAPQTADEGVEFRLGTARGISEAVPKLCEQRRELGKDFKVAHGDLLAHAREYGFGDGERIELLRPSAGQGFEQQSEAFL